MSSNITSNAVIYARYSSHGQTEQSIEGQLRVCKEFAERENLIIVGEYVDRAIPGKTDARPDFQRMISDSKKKQFDYVIVYKLDRFARNRYDSAIYKHKLKANDVRLLSAMENIGDNPESIILEAVLEASAEYYSLDLSQKVKRGMRESVLKGMSIGGVSLYGYTVIDKKISINEEEAAVMRYLFEEYAKGKPKMDIIKELNNKGIRNNRGKLLNANSFRSNLRNKKYMGVYEFQGEEYADIYPAIISADTFTKVQQLLDNKAYGQSESYKKKVDYLLRGKVFCGHCGSNMIGESTYNKNKVRYNYYSCRAKRKMAIVIKRESLRASLSGMSLSKHFSMCLHRNAWNT